MKKFFILFLFASSYLAAAPPTLQQVLPIFQAKCAVCHRGPYLDFTQYPFFSDLFPTPKDLMEEVKKRLTGLKKEMPPVNATPLTQIEKELLLNWIDSGMPEND